MSQQPKTNTDVKHPCLSIRPKVQLFWKWVKKKKGFFPQMEGRLKAFSVLLNQEVYYRETFRLLYKSNQSWLFWIGLDSFQCMICQASFSSDYKLQKHIAVEKHVQPVHEREKLEKCKICSKTFATKGCLKTHIRNFHKG